MNSKEVLAAIFTEMATLLELSGENPFKIRAYENAARVLTSSALSLNEIALNPPAGFGKGLLEKLEEFITSGQIADYQALAASFPEELFDLLKVQGLGPKKVKLLFHELGITSLEALEKACKEDKLLSVKGFGKKTQEKILTGISFLQQFKGQFLFAEAETEANAMVAFLQEEFPDLPIHIAGSLRRKKEVVKDVDLLIAATDGSLIMKRFVSFPGVHQVLMEGETKSAIQTSRGLQIDLRVIPPESLGPALCHFTGSKEHNTRMRSLALAKGKKLNEYGLFTNDSPEPLPTEEAVFAALGLAFIPPELREDLGEFEWAQQKCLPRLIEEHHLKGTLHAHTTASDGIATVSQMAQAAADLHLSWLGFTDHSRSAHYAHGLSIEKLQAQWQEIDDFNRRNSHICLLKGIESDILPDGSLDYPPDILEQFDFVIASVHSHFSMSREEMTTRILHAVRNPFTDVLGHPTGRLLLEREGYDLDLDAVLAACEKHRVMVEINSNPVRLDLDWRKIRSWRGSTLKFILGPDAHSTDGLKDLRFGLGIARKGALEPSQVMNCLSADAFLNFIHRRRTP